MVLDLGGRFLRVRKRAQRKLCSCTARCQQCRRQRGGGVYLLSMVAVLRKKWSFSIQRKSFPQPKEMRLLWRVTGVKNYQRNTMGWFHRCILKEVQDDDAYAYLRGQRFAPVHRRWLKTSNEVGWHGIAVGDQPRLRVHDGFGGELSDH